MKDVLKGVALIFAWVCGAVLFGWALGQIGGMILAPQIERLATPPLWYCIEGKVYEKFGGTYATVVPARTCLPVSKD